MNLKLFYGLPHDLTFVEMVNQMPDTEFQNLTRSTVPSLVYWQPAADRTRQLCHDCGLPIDPDGILCFEYPVSSLERAKPSYSDLMYIATSCAVAIEAKSTEPEYDSIEEWLRKGRKPEHRERVRDHWVRMIEQRGCVVDRQELPGLVYQALHRTASACSAAGRERVAAVVYMFFDTGRLDVAAYHDSLRRLSQAISGPGRPRIFAQTVQTKRTARFNEAEMEMMQSPPDDVPMLVRGSVLDTTRPLFEFASGQTVSFE